jgi:hypothetical protein
MDQIELLGRNKIRRKAVWRLQGNPAIGNSFFLKVFSYSNWINQMISKQI